MSQFLVSCWEMNPQSLCQQHLRHRATELKRQRRRWKRSGGGGHPSARHQHRREETVTIQGGRNIYIQIKFEELRTVYLRARLDVFEISQSATLLLQRGGSCGRQFSKGGLPPPPPSSRRRTRGYSCGRSPNGGRAAAAAMRARSAKVAAEGNLSVWVSRKLLHALGLILI